MTRADGPGARASGAPLAAATGGLTIERLVAVDPPREFRVHPRDRIDRLDRGRRRRPPDRRRVAPRRHADTDHRLGEGRRRTRSGRPTAGGSPTSAATRSGSSTPTGAGTSSSRAIQSGGSMPRWSPDGRQIAFVSRRRGWSQVHVVEAPIPRRGRPARDPKPPEPRAITGDRLRRRGLRLVGRRQRDRDPVVPRAGLRRLGDPSRRRRERRRAPGRRRRQGVGVRPAPDARRRLPLPDRRGRLVPGRPARRRRPRAGRCSRTASGSTASRVAATATPPCRRRTAAASSTARSTTP